MIKPMLAQARSEPFNCDKHLFEVKWDGTRCLGFIEDDRLRLQNRHLMDIGDRYPELACLRGLPAGTVIDGEIVVLKGKKRVDGTRVKTCYYGCGGYITKGKSICELNAIPQEVLESLVTGTVIDFYRPYLAPGGIP